jgi:hypothetical protein
MRVVGGVAAAAILMSCSGAHAANVNFVGTVVSICTLIATPGLMQVDEAGDLSSEALGGLAGILSVVSVGPHNIEVEPPVWGATPGYTQGGETFSVAYSGLGGVDQDYTTSTTDFDISDLTDVLTIDVNIDAPSQFTTGVYNASVEVTCGPVSP